MIEFSCPHCTKQFRVKDDSAVGRTGTCPHCGGSVTIPRSVPNSATSREQLKTNLPAALHAPGCVDPFPIRFIIPLAAAPIILGALIWLSLQAENLSGTPEPYYLANRFDDSYAASATANAAESIEAHVTWLVRYGTESIQFWLIIIASLLVLVFGLVLVQTERLIAAIKKRPDVDPSV